MLDLLGAVMAVGTVVVWEVEVVEEDVVDLFVV